MEIAEATHLILLERNRMRAMQATVSFLDEEQVSINQGESAGKGNVVLRRC